ncbi:hypothetical protein GGI18_002044 [Coemansia linderi]|uniref:Uncharacterized protein n=1 Tax=Coemansia linderi TaxID=2663919 RepID=A0ACC1KHB9_9FUNG|nr:hypothetical protein GGI18_002044 [Coemansia linderi]
MSMQNMVTGSDEDDHYLPGQLAHPNKALRKSLDDPHDSNMENDSDPEHATPRMRSGKRPQLPSQLDALTNSSAATISLSGASMQEQIRLAKDQAIEILRVLDAENMLEHGIDDYINDVESSYGSDTSGPKATFPKLRAAWTREEDRLLMVGVRVYGPNTESWPRIAMLVPGRTNKSCRKRWFHSLDPSLHKGPWTNEEDALLRQRVMQFPAQWSRVAEGITGRTDDQCAKRWRESLDPDIDRTKWRSEEDRLLLEKYKEYGTQWQKIATFFHGRPGLHCRNRWRKIQRIITQKERKSGPITPDDLTETLATVTESVNRRKTAQRSRLHQQQEIVDGLHATGQKKMSLKAQRRSQSQEQLYGVAPLAAPTEPAPAPIAAFGDGDSQLGAMRSYAAPPPPPLPQLRPSATRHMLGSSPPHETMGALFMPSDQHSTMAGVPAPAPAQLKGTPGGAKRSASMLFSPTEEQRLRLKHLGLKLYGCAAAPEQCNVAFADSASLNSHLKLCHPQVACLIPSLCNGTSAGYVGGLQQGLEISAQNSDGSDAATGSVAGGKGLRPYRCAMPDCNHAYKNVSGLEYHIFQSRKSNNHLMRDSPVADGLDGGGVDGHVPDVAMTERGAVFDNLIHGSVAIPGDNIMGGALALTSPSQAGGIAGSPVLQCVEVDCLARFSSEYGLRQHVAMQHPRPIRRAVKPSNRVKPGRGTPTEQMSPSASFWNTTTISDVLGAAAAMDAGPGQAMGLASMPTIPESAISTPVSQSMEAAMAAAMGYGAEAQGLALNGAGQPLGRGRAVPQAAHRRLMLQGLPPTDLAQFQFHTQAQSMQQDVQQPIAPNSAGPRYQRQFVSTLQLGQLQSQHPPPLYSSNSIIQCPVFACRQAFSDANALKHHLSYDHPRDAPMMSANASNPGSPMEGFLSTMPTNHQTPMFSMAVGPLSAGAPMQNRQGMQYLDPDRSKAPHWIDTNMWSSWIAAANGQGDVTAVAAATAMGITPGISGPQSFIPAASTPLTQPTYSQATSELLQMFQAVNRADTS